MNDLLISKYYSTVKKEFIRQGNMIFKMESYMYNTNTMMVYEYFESSL